MQKIILLSSILISIVILVILAGCGEHSTTEPKATTPQTTQPAATQKTAAQGTATEEDPCDKYEFLRGTVTLEPVQRQCNHIEVLGGGGGSEYSVTLYAEGQSKTYTVIEGEIKQSCTFYKQLDRAKAVPVDCPSKERLLKIIVPQD